MRRFPRTRGSHPEIPQNMGVASCHQVCVTPRPVSLASQSAPPSLMYLCKLCKVYLSILIFLRIMIPWIIFLARYVRIVHILRRWLKKWQPTRRLKCASYNTVHLSDHRRTLVQLISQFAFFYRGNTGVSHCRVEEMFCDRKVS